eukprot:2596462-Pyramimonas_sp.AAC.1
MGPKPTKCKSPKVDPPKAAAKSPGAKAKAKAKAVIKKLAKEKSEHRSRVTFPGVPTEPAAP